MINYNNNNDNTFKFYLINNQTTSRCVICKAQTSVHTHYCSYNFFFYVMYVTYYNMNERMLVEEDKTTINKIILYPMSMYNHTRLFFNIIFNCLFIYIIQVS